MRIGGIQRFSLVDYPGRISAVVFTQGCNFRCPYCHNTQLAAPSLFEPSMEESDLLAFLQMRRNLLQTVVISGGEALLHHDLPDFLAKVKNLGYSVKLDTNGSLPDQLELLLKEELIDYVALDYKAPLRLYADAAGAEVRTNDIVRSLRLLLEYGIQHEARTTVFRLFSLYDLQEAMDELHEIGIKRYFLQMYIRSQGQQRDLSQSGLDIASLSKALKNRFPEWGIRNLSRAQEKTAGLSASCSLV